MVVVYRDTCSASGPGALVVDGSQFSWSAGCTLVLREMFEGSGSKGIHQPVSV